MSCKFCSCITKRDLNIIWNSRSRYAIDNTCEVIASDNCSECGECCNEYFKLTGIESDGDLLLGVEFHKKVKDVVIAPFSEILHINYCPYCGKQVSKDIIDFDDMYSTVIEVEYDDGEIFDWETERLLIERGIK